MGVGCRKDGHCGDKGSQAESNHVCKVSYRVGDHKVQELMRNYVLLGSVVLR